MTRLKFVLIIAAAAVFSGSSGQVQNGSSTCKPITAAPAASTLKCTDKVCTATCAPKFKFPKGETVLTTECINQKWTIKSPKYKDLRTLPGCLPSCSPACANKGKCIAPNRCQCTQDFQGPTCREKACRQPPAMTRNAKRTCKPSQCTIQCMPGFKFKTMATTMNIQCRNGNWASTTRNLPINNHCEPYCNSKCLNGGKCIGSNKCQCPQNFRGPQCQFSTDRCSPKKFGFNGSYNCTRSETEMSCSLKCPEGVKFESPPAQFYKCKFAKGKFTPAKIPKCVYGEGVEVVDMSDSQTKPGSNKPTCNPNCKNGGTCLFHNFCQCPKNFVGAHCQHSVDRCSPKKLGFNGGVRCSGTATEMSCNLSCPEGIKFDSPPAAAYKCKFETGVFTPAKIPKCVYGEGVQVIQRTVDSADPGPVSCNPPCANGGTCVFHNLCQCARMFRGPTCQYSVERCSIKKTGINGGYKCSGGLSEMSCSIWCPEGIDFEFPPAAAYTCKYETGLFTPSRIPKCVYGDDVEVIRRTTSN